LKSVVTGGTGFIGSHLCRRLAELGHKVIAVDSGEIGGHSRLPSGCSLIETDISTLNHTEWSQILQGSDYVFHLAAKKYNSPGVTPDQIITTNISATLQLATAASSTGVKKLVFTSSLYAYGSLGPSQMKEVDIAIPSTLYGVSKLAGEGILRTVREAGGVSANVARLFFIFGPHQYGSGGYKSVIVSNFERIRKGLPPIICGDGMQELDYVYIDDCVDALVLLAETDNSNLVANVSSGVGLSILQLTQIMQDIAEAPGDIRFEAADWTYRSRRIGSPIKVNQDLGWRSGTSIEAGLREVWKELQLGAQQRG